MHTVKYGLQYGKMMESDLGQVPTPLEREIAIGSV